MAPNRSQEAPAADRLATVIAQAGATACFWIGCEGWLGLPPQTLADVLKALVATGQVRVVKVGGELRYRAAR